MKVWSSLRSLASALLHRARMEDEMEQELRAHIGHRADDLERSGIPRAEAERRARIEFGGYQRYKEKSRDALGTQPLENLVRDVRFSLRLLRKSPGFSAIAVLTLALGIGANTAIFTLIDGVMLRTLPVKDPEQLVQLKWNSRDWPANTVTSGYGGSSFSFPWFEQLRAQNQVFSNTFAFAQLGFDKPNVSIDAGGESYQGSGEMVSGEYFSGLGVTATLGRVLRDEDEQHGAPLVCVISYQAWTRHLARNRVAVGSPIKLNNVLFTVVGVAPPAFFGLDTGCAPDVWIPIIDRPELRPWASPPAGEEPMFASNRWWWVNVMGRLKPGLSEMQARPVVDAMFHSSVSASLHLAVDSQKIPRVELFPASHGLSRLSRRFSQPLRVLMTVVALVLLIACANVAGLMLTRASARHKEITVRTALGASRKRLAGQLLTESILLYGIGGAAGLLFAYWFSKALVSMISSGGTPIVVDLRPDPAVLAFTAGITLVSGVLSGVVPALPATRVKVTPGMRETWAAWAGKPGRRVSFGKSLVVVQVALSLLLLAGATLLLRTLANLRNQDFGFDHDHLLMFRIDPVPAGYSEPGIRNLYARVVAGVRATPGVRSASVSQLGLITGWKNSGRIYLAKYEVKTPHDAMAEWNAVGADFFETLGTRKLLGRGIMQRDVDAAAHVAVVNETLARHFFGEVNPIGQHFTPGTSRDVGQDFEIVGVVESAKYAETRQVPQPTYYVPYTVFPARPGGMYVEVRTAQSPSGMVASIRAAVRDVDPRLPLFDLKTQDAQIDEALMQERLLAHLSGLFSLLAGLLAAVGLYGLLSYAVAQRCREIGIRIALGAQPSSVLGMVVGQGAILALIGVAVGVVAALTLTRVMSSLLFGVTPADPFTYAPVAMIMMLVAVAASFVPAWRAMHVDPMVVLRYE